MLKQASRLILRTCSHRGKIPDARTHDVHA